MTSSANSLLISLDQFRHSKVQALKITRDNFRIKLVLGSWVFGMIRGNFQNTVQYLYFKLVYGSWGCESLNDLAFFVCISH